GRPAAGPELGKHDRSGSEHAVGAAALRVPAERRPVRHGRLVQPVGRGPPVPLGQSMSEALLEISALRVDFHHDGQLVRAVDGLTYSVRRGQSVAVIGDYASGKTVSSRAIMGLLPRTARVSGSIRFEDVEMVGLPEKAMRAHRGRGVAMVFQDPTRSLNPTMRIGAQIREAIQTHNAKVSRAAAQDRALELLELVRLPAARERLEQYPHQLSGGMRQRVMIAIA